jgi:hypothetical protein
MSCKTPYKNEYINLITKIVNEAAPTKLSKPREKLYGRMVNLTGFEQYFKVTQLMMNI